MSEKKSRCGWRCTREEQQIAPSKDGAWADVDDSNHLRNGSVVTSGVNLI